MCSCEFTVFLKSPVILTRPFDFGTTIKGDAHSLWSMRSMTPDFSIRSSSRFTFSWIAYGIGRAFMNLGVASSLRIIFALNFLMRPFGSSNISANFLITFCKVRFSFTVLH